MALNSDRYRPAHRGLPLNGRFNNLRRRLYRSHDGKALGVFKGMAESLGLCVFWTRAVGLIALVSLAGAMGAHGFKVTVLVAGFFYLLLALLMQPPRQPGVAADPVSPTAGSVPAGNVPPRVPRPARYQAASNRPRVDLAQLDRQLDGLDRRIQRMEAIVTDREYDWNRRMES